MELRGQIQLLSFQINQLNVKKDLIKTQNLDLQTKIKNNNAELLNKTTQINNLEQLKVR